MYLQTGTDCMIDTDDIIGIFDMDNTTVSRQGRSFLPDAEKRGQIVNSIDELPKSYIVTSSEDMTKIYLSSISSRMLAKRKNTI